MSWPVIFVNWCRPGGLEHIWAPNYDPVVYPYEHFISLLAPRVLSNSRESPAPPFFQDLRWKEPTRRRRRKRTSKTRPRSRLTPVSSNGFNPQPFQVVEGITTTAAARPYHGLILGRYLYLTTFGNGVTPSYFTIIDRQRDIVISSRAI